MRQVWRIRAMGPLDVPEASRIHRDAFDWEAWDQKAIMEVMAIPGAAGLMAVDPRVGDLRACGLALYLLVAPDAELLTLAVRPPFRRRGVASALMTEFLARAGAHGANRALLEVAEDNIPAQRLYARLGFRPEGVRADYYSRPGKRRVAAHLLHRRIDSPPSDDGLD